MKFYKKYPSVFKYSYNDEFLYTHDGTQINLTKYNKKSLDKLIRTYILIRKVTVLNNRKIITNNIKLAKSEPIGYVIGEIDEDLIVDFNSKSIVVPKIKNKKAFYELHKWMSEVFGMNIKISRKGNYTTSDIILNKKLINSPIKIPTFYEALKKYEQILSTK